MSQSITLSRSFSNADSFLAAQRELYREYRRTHKLDAAAEAKYVANVKDAATCIDVTHNSFWVFGNTAPTSDSYVSFVVLRRIKNAIRRCIIAVKVNRAANIAVVDNKPQEAENRCLSCKHRGQTEINDVACCNLCGENGLDFYRAEEEPEDIGEAYDASWRELDETGIDEFFAAQEKTKVASVVVDEPMGICPVCHKLVSLEWHDHADEAGQLDETGE